MKAGWVYVLATRQPGIFKVGMTGRTPAHRQIELECDQRYGAFAPFRVVWKRPVADCGAVEYTVHRMLSDHRVRWRGTRELFRIDLCTIEQVIEAAATERSSWYLRIKPPRFMLRRLWFRIAGAAGLGYVAIRILAPH